MTLHLVIEGEPVAKGRPRMTRSGHCYTPKETRQNADYCAEVAAEAIAGQGVLQPLTGPLRLTVSYFLKRPKSVKREHPTVRPDTDNFVKQTMDYLNGMAWVDDAQVVKIEAEKAYSGEPRTVISISQFP